MPRPTPPCCHRASRAGFTLMEILVVVAIIAVVMTMAMPAMFRQLHPESMQKAVSDIMEACSHARAQAILNDTPMELRIYPFDHLIRVQPGARAGSTSAIFSKSVSGEAWRMEDLAEEGGRSRAGGAENYSARISTQIRIEMLDVNFIEFKDEEVAAVRFNPNGTSDEFTIVLNNDKNEWRKISLEAVTGLPDVQTDYTKFLR